MSVENLRDDLQDNNIKHSKLQRRKSTERSFLIEQGQANSKISSSQWRTINLGVNHNLLQRTASCSIKSKQGKMASKRTCLERIFLTNRGATNSSGVTLHCDESRTAPCDGDCMLMSDSIERFSASYELSAIVLPRDAKRKAAIHSAYCLSCHEKNQNSFE